MHLSIFEQIEIAPPDPIIGLTEAFNADPNPKKVNLGVGVYQDAKGRVPLLDVVRVAGDRWREKEDTKSYLPIDGLATYNKAVQKLLFGEDAAVISEGRVVTVQALGGTGALKVGADFLRKFFRESDVWISDPSWENHRMLFEAAGFSDVKSDRITTTLEYESGEEACLAAFAGGPVAMAYSRFDDTTRASAYSEYLESISSHRRGNGYALPGEFVVTLGFRR